MCREEWYRKIKMLNCGLERVLNFNQTGLIYQEMKKKRWFQVLTNAKHVYRKVLSITCHNEGFEWSIRQSAYDSSLTVASHVRRAKYPKVSRTKKQFQVVQGNSIRCTFFPLVHSTAETTERGGAVSRVSVYICGFIRARGPVIESCYAWYFMALSSRHAKLDS